MDKPVYLNPWWKEGEGYGPEYYTPERFIKTYKNFDIYYRAGCFDVVSFGTCVTQMHGLKGVQRWIDAQR